MLFEYSGEIGKILNSHISGHLRHGHICGIEESDGCLHSLLLDKISKAFSGLLTEPP